MWGWYRCFTLLLLVSRCVSCEKSVGNMEMSPLAIFLMLVEPWSSIMVVSNKILHDRECDELLLLRASLRLVFLAKRSASPPKHRILRIVMFRLWNLLLWMFLASFPPKRHFSHSSWLIFLLAFNAPWVYFSFSDDIYRRTLSTITQWWYQGRILGGLHSAVFCPIYIPSYDMFNFSFQSTQQNILSILCPLLFVTFLVSVLNTLWVDSLHAFRLLHNVIQNVTGYHFLSDNDGVRSITVFFVDMLQSFPFHLFFGFGFT